MYSEESYSSNLSLMKILLSSMKEKQLKQSGTQRYIDRVQRRNRKIVYIKTEFISSRKTKISHKTKENKIMY